MARKIAELPEKNVCRDREHHPPSMQVFESGIWEHECPTCGYVTKFRVDRPTLSSRPLYDLPEGSAVLSETSNGVAASRLVSLPVAEGWLIRAQVQHTLNSEWKTVSGSGRVLTSSEILRLQPAADRITQLEQRLAERMKKS